MNALAGIVVTEFGIIIDVIDVLFGNLIELNALQSLNASIPIDVTESGIVIDVTNVQPWKAQSPMVVNKLLVGNIIDVNAIQSLNALVPIVVTVLGIIIDVVATLVDSLIDVSLLQPKNVQL